MVVTSMTQSETADPGTSDKECGGDIEPATRNESDRECMKEKKMIRKRRRI